MARRPSLTLLALAASLLAAYHFFLLPDLPALGDSAKLQAVAATLGTPHPSGYPLWLMLTHGFGRLLPWGSPAYAANLLTALFSVAGSCALFAALRQLRVRRVAAVIAALAFGLTPTLWSQSVVAEVYTLSYFFLSAVTYALLRWRAEVLKADLRGRAPSDGCLHLALALYVLSFTDHLTTACLGPGILVFVLLVRRRALWSLRTAAVVAGSAALALLVYGYILWRSHSPSVSFLEMQAASWKDLLLQLASDPRRRHLFETDPAIVLGERLPATAARVWREFLWVLPVAFWGLRRRVGAVHALLGLYALGNLFFALTFSVPDGFVYFIPVYFVVAMYLGLGLEGLLRSFPGQRWLPAAGLAGAALLGAIHAPGLLAQKTFRDAESRRLDGLIERICVGPALVVSDRYDPSMALLYRSLLARPALRVRHLPPVSYEIPEALAPLRRYLSQDLPLHSRNHADAFPAGHPVYCICASPERFEPHGIRVEDLGGGLARLWPAPAADPPLPRARVVHRLETVEDVVKALERLRADLRRPARHPYPGALRLGSPAGVAGEADGGEEGHSEAQVLRSGDRQIEVRVRSSSPGWLLLTEPLSTRWRVTVDGAPADLLDLDLTYRGAAVGAGEHRVLFWQP